MHPLFHSFLLIKLHAQAFESTGQFVLASVQVAAFDIVMNRVNSNHFHV